MDVVKIAPRRRRRWAALLLWAVTAASTPFAGTMAAEAEFSQYALQAAYVFKFGGFVVWPPASFEAPDSPLVLCVQGTGPLGDGFEKSLEGKTIGARPLVVRHVQAPTPDAGCHIYFIAASDAKQAQPSLAALHGSPVLTITDAAAPGNQGEIIHFVVAEDRVRFTIDDEVAEAGGLDISSRLLSLAVSVKEGK
jgi:hypothetical protein